MWLLILAIVLLVGGFLLSRYYRPKPIISGNFPDITAAQKMSPEQLKKYAQKTVDDSKVTINVYPEIYIESNGINGSLWIQNLPTNTTGQQAILKDSEGTVIFKSGLLEPGYEVREVKLTKKQSQGTHKGSVEIEFYDLKTKKKMSQTSVDVTITVK